MIELSDLTHNFDEKFRRRQFFPLLHNEGIKNKDENIH